MSPDLLLPPSAAWAKVRIYIRRYRNQAECQRVEPQLLLDDPRTILMKRGFDVNTRKASPALEPEGRKQCRAWNFLLPLRLREVLDQQVLNHQAWLVAGSCGGYKRIQQVEIDCVSGVVARAARDRQPRHMLFRPLPAFLFQ